MSIKKENEITVKVNSGFDELVEILKNKGFKAIDKFTCKDIYYIHKTFDISKSSIREIIKNAVILRDVRKDKVLMFKEKKIDENGNILEQKKVECNVLNIEDAKKFLEAIGYKELMQISEDDVSYIKNGLKLTIKNVINGDNLIEIETSDIPGFSTIEDLKEKLLELKLPIDTSNFFVKKAEIELGKALNRKV